MAAAPAGAGLGDASGAVSDATSDAARRGRASDAVSDAVLRPGRRDEARLLSDLALRSKGHWGYDADFLDACREELTLTPDAAAEAVTAEVRGDVVAFHLLEELDAPDAGRGRLAMLFVDPAAIGSGIGPLLYGDAVAKARARGWRSLVLDADPGAEPFYLRMGARRVGEVPSGSIPGRVLPVLEIDFTRARST